MAHRLATEYVKTYLEITEAEMMKLLQLFSQYQAQQQVKVLDNGSQELVFEDEAGEEIVLSFERRSNKYCFYGSCRIASLQLANILRKAVSAFKGNAIVNRIYTGFTMTYHYEQGKVVRIVETKGEQQKLVYAYSNQINQLEELFRKSEVEREIARLKSDVDALLDVRYLTNDSHALREIDLRLQALAFRLFTLEA